MRLVTVLSVCLAVASAQLQGNADTKTFKTERVDPNSVVASRFLAGHFNLGIADVEEEYREEFIECQKDLLRLRHWKKDFLPDSHPLVRRLMSRRTIQRAMDLALQADAIQNAKLANFSAYVQLDIGYRGPVEDPNWHNCDDLCPTRMDRVGMAYYKGEPCLIVHPEQQMLHFKDCTTFDAQHVVQSNQDLLSYSYKNRFACLPDSFVEKRAIAFCLKRKIKHCEEITIRLPLSCSPKIAKCKYTEAGMRLRQQKLAEKNRNKKRPSFLRNYKKGLGQN